MIAYRRPHAHEAEAMAELHVQCWREAYVDYVPLDLMNSFSAQKQLPMWQAVLGQANTMVKAAYLQEKPIGFIIAGPTREQHIENQDGHISALYIAEKCYRRGIGRALLAQAAIHWAADGGKNLTVGVLAQNAPARRFYEALGARLVKLGTYTWDEFELPNAIYVFEDLPALAAKVSRSNFF